MAKRRGKITRRPGQEHRAELAKLIAQASQSRAVWEIWDDLMYMSAAAISQPLRWVQEREDEYLRRIGKYDTSTQALFPLMFAEIVESLEEEGLVDMLGGMYMELELGNHWKGQFFTPDSVCRLMAEMQFGDADSLAADIAEKGHISANDPCCGGGATLIALASICKERGIDFQNHILFVGQDVDPVVARMCYIQMSLLGMAGYVIIGNTLLMDIENFDYWFTPVYFSETWHWRRKWQQLTALLNITDKP